MQLAARGQRVRPSDVTESQQQTLAARPHACFIARCYSAGANPPAWVSVTNSTSRNPRSSRAIRCIPPGFRSTTIRSPHYLSAPGDAPHKYTHAFKMSRELSRHHETADHALLERWTPRMSQSTVRSKAATSGAGTTGYLDPDTKLCAGSRYRGQERSRAGMW
jgi:hypothetical protein